MTKPQAAAATLIVLSWVLCGLAVMVAYGVADVYASEQTPIRSGMFTGLEVGSLPLMPAVLLCLGAAVAAAGHRVLLWLAVATAPVGFLAVAVAGVGGAL